MGCWLFYKVEYVYLMFSSQVCISLQAWRLSPASREFEELNLVLPNNAKAEKTESDGSTAEINLTFVTSVSFQYKYSVIWANSHVWRNSCHI